VGWFGWPQKENYMNSEFWALILGLMATIFGGFALCYGFVMLCEKAVQRFHAGRLVPVFVPPIRRAA
jgi:hypothetical protein